jgi:hypothetical protein
MAILAAVAGGAWTTSRDASANAAIRDVESTLRILLVLDKERLPPLNVGVKGADHCVQKNGAPGIGG